MNLIDYLPSHMQGLIEFRQIINTEQPEIDALIKAIETAPDDFFLSTLTSYGVKRWEKILKVKPSENDTLETRRFRVLSRWNDRIPYTWNSLIEKLNTLCGKGNYTISLQNDIYTLNLETHLGVYGTVDELNSLLDDIIPCNLIIILHNVLYGGNETPLYLGVALSESIHYVLSSDIKGEFSISSELYAASVASNSLKYEISNDIVTNESINGEAYTANVSIVGMQYELS